VHTKRLAPDYHPSSYSLFERGQRVKHFGGLRVRWTLLQNSDYSEHLIQIAHRVYSLTISAHSTQLLNLHSVVLDGCQGEQDKAQIQSARIPFAEALAYASEHADGIFPELFVDFIFNDAATRFGNAELRELAVQMGMLEWWICTWTDMRKATHTRKWCKAGSEATICDWIWVQLLKRPG
jgi:hypothetical protein